MVRLDDQPVRTAEEHAAWRARLQAAIVRALQRQRSRLSVTAAAVPPPPPAAPAPPYWDPYTWDDDVEEEVRPEAEAAVAAAVAAALGLLPSAVAAFGGTLGLGDGWPDRIVASARSLGAGAAERLASISPLDPDRASKAAAVFDGAEGQAANVASLATHAGNAVANDASQAAADQGFSLEKTWRSMNDERVREAHADLEGETVDASEPFVTVDGDELMFPGDPSAPDEAIMGCRCWLEFSGFGTEGEVPDSEMPGAAMGESTGE